MFHILLGLYDEYVLLYELFRCYVIVFLLVNAGFKEKELIWIREAGLQQTSVGLKVSLKHLVAFILNAYLGKDSA